MFQAAAPNLCCRDAREKIAAYEMAAGSAKSEVDDLAVSLRTKEVEKTHLHNEKLSLKAQVT